MRSAKMCNRLLLGGVAMAAITAIAGGGLAAEKVTLTFDGRYAAGAQQGGYEAFKQAIAAYEQLNPDVKIEYVSSADHVGQLQKILTQMAAGTAPDIIHLYDEWMPDLASQGLLAAIPPMLTGDLQQELYPSALAAGKYKGQLYGVPTENQVQALMYSKAILDQAGMTPPATWTELDAMVSKLTKIKDGKTTQWGLTFNGGGWGYTGNFLAQLTADGGTFIDASGNAQFASSEGYDVLRRWVRWSRSEQAIGGALPTTTALGIGYPWWKMGQKPTYTQDVGVTSVPAGTVRRSADHYGWGLYVPATSKNAAEAWKFIRFLSLTQPGQSITWIDKAVASVGSLPDNQADIRAPEFQGDLSFYQAFSNNLPYAVDEPQWPEGEKRQDLLASEITKALNGKVSPVEALDNAAHGMQVILDKYK